MHEIQEKEKTFKKEVKVFWEEIQNKLNFSYSELNDLYKENKKYEVLDNEHSPNQKLLNNLPNKNNPNSNSYSNNKYIQEMNYNQNINEFN